MCATLSNLSAAKQVTIDEPHHIFLPEAKNRTLVSEADYRNPRIAAGCVIPYPRPRDAQQFSHTIQGKQRCRLWDLHLHRMLLDGLLPFRNHLIMGRENCIT